MWLTRKLIGRLNRVWDKTGKPQNALRINPSDGASMSWSVNDGILTLTPAVGSEAEPQSIDLSTINTLGALSTTLIAAGYTVAGLSNSLVALSPLILLDGSGTTTTSNGNLLKAWTAWHWGYLDAAAVELDLARTAIEQIPLEMATTTADGSWLDLLGSYYDVPRNPSELDSQYGPRIIAQTIMPKCNNIAIQALIQKVTGQQVTVTDVALPGADFPLFNGQINFDGSREYTFAPTTVYGLFDVVLGYDMTSSGDPTSFLATITTLINEIRAAGTHLRSLSLSDAVLTAAAIEPSEVSDTLIVTLTYPYNGEASYNGQIDYQPLVIDGTMEGTFNLPVLNAPIAGGALGENFVLGHSLLGQGSLIGDDFDLGQSELPPT